ncbi:unnamed protein product [Cyclocybe aegerita]|uniref:BTB domain-containing protein n=1 Tax=Cyclocybe aegerita TaxID=1973307 RepID=A0A8S0WDM7_CYCAE|nr:unnamed protein product [Cyclocybe aegerita]
MSLPLSKRFRMDVPVSDAESEASTLPVITRSKYWFKDGNVVLQAEETQFRVHQSMLAHHSRVFNDLFGIPQPEVSQDPMVDGCPLVPLSDTAADVRQIMAIFYDNISFLDLRNSMQVDQISAMLRMGKKYEIDYLMNEALQRLRCNYPTTLAVWDESFDSSNPNPIEDVNDSVLNAGIISLGHEHSIFTILPSAYFHYTTKTSPEAIVSGEDDDFLISPERPAVLYELKNVFWSMDDGVITDLAPWVPNETISVKLCASCLASVKACFEEARQQLWQELPAFFGFAKWEDLRDFDS